jgi:hypothetical protein
MVLVSDVHMMASPYIVSNSDGEVSDDATPSTNQAATNRNVTLIKDGRGSPHNHASFPERREFLAPHIGSACRGPKRKSPVEVYINTTS